jgi:hypothetical protein
LEVVGLAFSARREAGLRDDAGAKGRVDLVDLEYVLGGWQKSGGPSKLRVNKPPHSQSSEKDPALAMARSEQPPFVGV